MNYKNEKFKTQALQLIIGQMVGDSLLLPYEFLDKNFSHNRLEKYGMKQSLFLGYGVTSDDSDHLIMTMQALMESDTVEVFQKKLSWKLRWWLLTGPPGIGLATLKSIIKLWFGIKVSGVYSSGNGPLMRVPAIAIYYGDIKEKRLNFIKSSNALTHKAPDAISAAQGIGNFIGYIATHKKLPTPTLLQELLLDIPTPDPIWQRYVQLFFSNKDLPLDKFLEVIGCQKFVSGYIMHTALFCMYVLYHSDNPNSAFKLIIHSGGDTDTIGAVTGACLGMLYGTKNMPTSKICPQISADFEGLVYQNFWKKLIMKNIVATPIILCHGIYRIIQKIIYIGR